MLDVYELDIHGDHPPRDLVDQLGCSLAAIYAALAYYYDHPEVMRRVRARHDDATTRLERNALRPPETQV